MTLEITLTMYAQAKIQKWGNSLALRISGLMKTVPHFKEGMLVDIEISEEGIHISPAKPQSRMPLSEAELLKGLNAKSAHAEELLELHEKELGD